MAKCNKCEGEFKNLGVHERFCGTKDKDVTDEIMKPTKTISKDKVVKDENPSSKSSDDKILSAVNNLAKLVENLAGRVENIEEKREKIQETADKQYIPEVDETYPTQRQPSQYRRIVNEILTSEFDFDIEDVDPHNFRFAIYIPDRYSSLTESDKERGLKDVRSKIIPVIMGENGVTAWCKLVKQNLAKYFTQQGGLNPFK